MDAIAAPPHANDASVAIFATQLAILIKWHSTERAGTPRGWAILSTCIVERNHVLKAR